MHEVFVLATLKYQRVLLHARPMLRVKSGVHLQMMMRAGSLSWTSLRSSASRDWVQMRIILSLNGICEGVAKHAKVKITAERLRTHHNLVNGAQ